jgi:hypothetical protein
MKRDAPPARVHLPSARGVLAAWIVPLAESLGNPGK